MVVATAAVLLFFASAGELLGVTGTLGSLLMGAFWGYFLSALMMACLVAMPTLLPSLLAFIIR